jgi:hypothetical protein
MYATGDPIPLSEEDDGKLFVIRIIKSGEERIARYHHRRLVGHELRFPRFTDPDHPEDYRCWVHDGWGGYAVRRV